jgi:hypothetical protein
MRGEQAGRRSKKPAQPRSWKKAVERATRAYEANRARLNAAGSSGLASDRTLSARGYDPDPQGGGPTVGPQIAKQAARRRTRGRWTKPIS